MIKRGRGKENRRGEQSGLTREGDTPSGVPVWASFRKCFFPCPGMIPVFEWMPAHPMKGDMGCNG